MSSFTKKCVWLNIALFDWVTFIAQLETDTFSSKMKLICWKCLCFCVCFRLKFFVVVAIAYECYSIEMGNLNRPFLNDKAMSHALILLTAYVEFEVTNRQNNCHIQMQGRFKWFAREFSVCINVCVLFFLSFIYVNTSDFCT